VKRTKGGFHSEAEEFLRSSWGAYLADLVGIQAKAIWRDTKRLHLRDRQMVQAA